jgi:hypothetical protein
MYQENQIRNGRVQATRAVIKRLIKVDNSESIDDPLTHFIMSSDPRLRQSTGRKSAVILVLKRYSGTVDASGVLRQLKTERYTDGKTRISSWITKHGHEQNGTSWYISPGKQEQGRSYPTGTLSPVSSRCRLPGWRGRPSHVFRNWETKQSVHLRGLPHVFEAVMGAAKNRFPLRAATNPVIAFYFWSWLIVGSNTPSGRNSPNSTSVFEIDDCLRNSIM